jgi:phosphoglycolate phosphatase
MLANLAAAGVKIGVVSSNSENTVRQVLGESSRHVSHYACSASMFGKAPKFRRPHRQSNVDATVVLCVGAEVRDLEAARSVGLLPTPGDAPGKAG